MRLCMCYKCVMHVHLCLSMCLCFFFILYMAQFYHTTRSHINCIMPLSLALINVPTMNVILKYDLIDLLKIEPVMCYS